MIEVGEDRATSAGKRRKRGHNTNWQAVGVSVLNPLEDGRWSQFVDSHPGGGVFHSIDWLRALHATYGYEPLVVTTAGENEPLSNGMVFCKVNSWLTGSRLVSLPFSDHCEPLVDEGEQLAVLLEGLKDKINEGQYKYFEVRSRSALDPSISKALGIAADESYCGHMLDLGPSLEDIFKGFHKSCIQRKIHKAEQQHLSYEEGRSDATMTKFYELLLKTRRRHQLPPQSRMWYQNLSRCLGEKLKVRVVSLEGRPIASIITIHFKDHVLYKYGASDAQYHNLGGMVLLMWRAIQDAKLSGARSFDFGRSEVGNEGLVSFKDHFKSSKSTLGYSYYPASSRSGIESSWRRSLVQLACAHLPDPLLERLGAALYRHAG